MSVIKPTRGYRKGECKVFDLAPGDELPAGWSDKPHPGDHPNAPHELQPWSHEPDPDLPTTDSVVVEAELAPAPRKRK